MLGSKSNTAAAVKPLGGKKRGVGFERDMERTFWTIMTPFVIMFLVFRVYPIVWGFILSFTNFTGFNLDSLKFVELDNYKHVFTDREALPSIWKVFKQAEYGVFTSNNHIVDVINGLENIGTVIDAVN